MTRLALFAPLLFATSLWAAEPPEASEAAQAQEASAPAEDAEGGPITYTAVPSRSFLGVEVRYDRDAMMKGHDHVLVASTFDGSITWDPSDPTACKVSLGFPVTALQVDPPGSRDRLGLEGDTPEGDKDKIKKNALSKRQLHADDFPRIAFESTACTPKGDRVDVTGSLTIRGVGKTITAPMKVTASPTGLSAKGQVEITGSRFGFDPYTALLGALRNDDTYTLRIDISATPQG